MANEYKLPYTGSEINEKLRKIDNMPTKLAELEDDVTHRLVTDTEKSVWNAKAEVSTIPTKVSQLANDSKYLTSVPNGYAKTEDIPTTPEDIGAQPKGNYALKSEIPTVPTKVSAFENDKGYLTQHQDISGKLDKSELTSAINTALAQAKESGQFDGDGVIYSGISYGITRPSLNKDTLVISADKSGYESFESGSDILYRVSDVAPSLEDLNGGVVLSIGIEEQVASINLQVDTSTAFGISLVYENTYFAHIITEALAAELGCDAGIYLVDLGIDATLNLTIYGYEGFEGSNALVPPNEWYRDIPEVKQGEYLWTKTVTEYGLGRITTAYSVSYIGLDGENGEDGYSPTITLSQGKETDGRNNVTISVVSEVNGETIIEEAKIVDGRNGTNGKTAYQYAKDGGYSGTEAEFAEKLASNVGDSVSAHNTDISAHADIRAEIKQLSYDKLDIAELFDASQSNNYADMSTLKVGMIHTDGVVYTGGSYDTYRYLEGYIPVSEGEVLSVQYTQSNMRYWSLNETHSGGRFARVTAYDEGKVVINSASVKDQFTYTVPSGVSFVRVTLYNTFLTASTDISIVKDATAIVDYVEYGSTVYSTIKPEFIPNANTIPTSNGGVLYVSLVNTVYVKTNSTFHVYYRNIISRRDTMLL